MDVLASGRVQRLLAVSGMGVVRGTKSVCFMLEPHERVLCPMPSGVGSALGVAIRIQDQTSTVWRDMSALRTITYLGPTPPSFKPSLVPSEGQASVQLLASNLGPRADWATLTLATSYPAAQNCSAATGMNESSINMVSERLMISGQAIREGSPLHEALLVDIPELLTHATRTVTLRIGGQVVSSQLQVAPPKLLAVDIDGEVLKSYSATCAAAGVCRPTLTQYPVGSPEARELVHHLLQLRCESLGGR